MKLPDFIIGGAARSGTTTLYELLKKIDVIFLPPNKRPEPHFFLKSWEFKKGLNYYSNRYFKDSQEGQIIGECSTSYLYRHDLAKKIQTYLPNLKWIFILRNPLDRLISQYFFNIQNKIEYNDINFALRYEKERVQSTILHWRELSPFDYTGRSLYSKGIEKYIKVFGKDNVLVILFDDFVVDHLATIKRVLNFLGIYNYKKYIKNIPAKLPKLNVGQKTHKEIYINKDVGDRLLELFIDDIGKLEKILHLNLDNWKENIRKKLKRQPIRVE